MILHQRASGGTAFLSDIVAMLRQLFRPLFANPEDISAALDAVDRAEQAALNSIALRAARSR